MRRKLSDRRCESANGFAVSAATSFYGNDRLSTVVSRSVAAEFARFMTRHSVEDLLRDELGGQVSGAILFLLRFLPRRRRTRPSGLTPHVRPVAGKFTVVCLSVAWS